MSEPQDPTGPEQQQPPVGSVGEEAAKLLGALSEWARDSGDVGAGLGAGVSGLADQAAGALHDVNEHLATGAAECTYCPVCRTVHVVRSASPEVKGHLASAASSFLQAVAGALATVPPPGGRPGETSSEIQRIDLDSDDSDDDD